MLGKLLKYEIKATARYYLPMLPVMILLAVVNRLLFTALPNNQTMEVVSFIAISTLILMILSAFIIGFIIMIQRFYKSLLGEEGYLSFTLPVSATTHIVNKLIVPLMWYILTFFVCVSSILIIIPDYSWIPEIKAGLVELADQFEQLTNMGFSVFVFEVISMIVISTIASILMIYASIALGHLAKSNRILVSFGAFFGLNTLSQVISGIIMAIFGTSLFNFDQFNPKSFTNTFFLVPTLINLVLGIAFFILTQRILSKHLNLE